MASLVGLPLELSAAASLAAAIYSSIIAARFVLRSVTTHERCRSFITPTLKEISVLVALGVVIMSSFLIPNTTVVMQVAANTTVYATTSGSRSTATYIVEYGYNATPLYYAVLPSERELVESVLGFSMLVYGVSVSAILLVLGIQAALVVTICHLL